MLGRNGGSRGVTGSIQLAQTFPVIILTPFIIKMDVFYKALYSFWCSRVKTR